jgi:hypothetical protein
MNQQNNQVPPQQNNQVLPQVIPMPVPVPVRLLGHAYKTSKKPRCPKDKDYK